MDSSIMTKPVGGRGQKASKPTMMRRIPEGIREAVDVLAELYRDDEWDGTVEGLNLISGNKQKSYDSTKPDIKNELEELREWKRRAEIQLREMSDLRESLTQLQRSNIQADSNLAKAVAMKCQFEDEVKKLRAQVDHLDAENLKLMEQTADQNLVIQNLTSGLALVPEKSGDVKANRLQEIRDRTLASLKLGKQSSSYKTVKQALDRFIERLNE